jgi:hypothetical protein
MSLQLPCLRPVLILGGIAALLAGCRDQNNDPEWWRNEQQKIELSQYLELLQYRLAMRSGNEAEHLAAIQSATAKNRTVLSSLRMTQETLTGKVQSLQQQVAVAAQQAQQRTRTKAIGQHFDSLTLASGRTFHDVSVKNISDSGVSIRHAHGAARLRYSDLLGEQRVYFGLSETSALAAEREEAEAAANYERLLASQLQDAQQIQQKKRWTSNANQRQTRRPSPALATNHQPHNSALHQSVKPKGTSSFRVWRSRPRTYYYTPVYRYYGPVCRDPLPIQRPLPSPKPKSGSSS